MRIIIGTAIALTVTMTGDFEVEDTSSEDLGRLARVELEGTTFRVKPPGVTTSMSDISYPDWDIVHAGDFVREGRQLAGNPDNFDAGKGSTSIPGGGRLEVTAEDKIRMVGKAGQDLTYSPTAFLALCNALEAEVVGKLPTPAPSTIP